MDLPVTIFRVAIISWSTLLRRLVPMGVIPTRDRGVHAGCLPAILYFSPELIYVQILS